MKESLPNLECERYGNPFSQYGGGDLITLPPVAGFRACIKIDYGLGSVDRRRRRRQRSLLLCLMEW